MRHLEEPYTCQKRRHAPEDRKWRAQRVVHSGLQQTLPCTRSRCQRVEETYCLHPIEAFSQRPNPVDSLWGNKGENWQKNYYRTCPNTDLAPQRIDCFLKMTHSGIWQSISGSNVMYLEGWRRETQLLRNRISMNREQDEMKREK